MDNCRRGWELSVCFFALLMVSGCGRLSVTAQKTAVNEGEFTQITATVSSGGEPAAEQQVEFRVVDGFECGALSANQAPTNEMGMATVNFTGNMGVEDCRATVEASIEGESGRASLFVNKLPLTSLRIDGVSLLVLILLASFAVDRVVRAVLFLLGFLPVWRRLAPDPDDPTTTYQAAQRHRLVYALMSGGLAIGVLSWLGKVRVLTALGFTQVDPLIDTLFTGLLVMGGADRVESLMQKLGAGSAAGAPPATPVEITGHLRIEESGKSGGGLDVKGTTS